MSSAVRILKVLGYVDSTLRASRLTADEYHAVHDKLEAVRSRAAGDLTQRVRDDELARERAMREALRAERAADAVQAEVTE